MTKVAQQLLECNNQRQVIDLVNLQAKAALREWKRRLIQEAVEGFIDRFHGQKWLKIRMVVPTPWICSNCGPRASQQVKRNGHYHRQLIILEGVICIRMPQIKCLKCGRQIAITPIFLPKRKRYWIKLDRKITELYLSGASYRQVKTMLDRAMEWDCGHELMEKFPEGGQNSFVIRTKGNSQSAVSG